MVGGSQFSRHHSRFRFRTTAAGDLVKEAERSEQNAADAISVKEANNFIMIPNPAMLQPFSSVAISDPMFGCKSLPTVYYISATAFNWNRVESINQHQFSKANLT